MAELINKKDAIEQIKSIPYATQEEVFFMSTAVSRMRKMSTTTEAEIRSKAIDEFAEKLGMKITDFVLEHQSQLTFVSGVSMCWKFVDEIAEQLKEK